MRIHHIALRVRDCERSLAFYSELLGLVETRRSIDVGIVRSVWLRAGDAVLMLERELRGASHGSGSGHVLVLGGCDLVEIEGRLHAAGVSIVDRTDHTIYFLDPDGHRVGVSGYVFDA